MNNPVISAISENIDIQELKAALRNVLYTMSSIPGRKSILNNAGINQNFIDQIDFNLNSVEVISIITSEFLKCKTSNNNVSNIPLIRLAKYSLKSEEHKYNLNGNNIETFEKIISISARVKSEKNRDILPDKEVTYDGYLKIDDNFIVDFDLIPLSLQLRQEIEICKGIFSFLINSDSERSNKYFIERILRELAVITGKKCDPPIYIPLSGGIVPIQPQAIEEYLLNKYKCTNLVDFLQPNCHSDKILIIKIRRLDEKTIEFIIKKFIDAIKSECEEYLQTQRRCLFVFFVNSNNLAIAQENNNLIPLEIPANFSIDHLINWLIRYFSNKNIKQDLLNDLIEEIKFVQGDVSATYFLIYDFIQETKEPICTYD